MPVIPVDIESNRPVIAANLEQLRYLVFQGMKGDTGDSAYELAVSLGFEGTEAEWLASLRGTDGADGKDGKNYGVVVDGSEEDILELKSVELQGGSALGAAREPMDDLTANELLDCIYSYIDNADKLFYGGMNASNIAMCTDFETVQTKIENASNLDADFKTAVASAQSLEEIRTLAANMADDGLDTKHHYLALALNVTGDWANKIDTVPTSATYNKYVNARAAVDYLLSGRKPIHCAWFAYLISSGIRYETGLYAGNAEAKRFYDWGFDWAGYDSGGYPLARMLVGYCMDQGYGFELNGDFSKLRTGDILFFANGSDPEYWNIGHVGIFLTHNADRTGCTIAEVDSTNLTDTFPVQITQSAYTSDKMQICTIAARLPYAGAGRVGQLKNLFSDEASHRDEAVSITASSPIFVTGRFAETLKPNRFYTLVISLNRAAGIGDMIRIQGAGSTSTGVFGSLYASAPESADGVYCLTAYSGIYNDAYNLRERLNGWGVRFRSFDPENTAGEDGQPSPAVGVAQEATVKWIACYEGIHHVGRSGFVPYVSDLAITQQPTDATIAHDGSAVFHVEAQGAGLIYQWQYLKPDSSDTSWKNSTSATGYNTDTMTVVGATTSLNRNGYQYRCVITDSAGNSVTSDPATLHVLAAIPVVDAEPTQGSGNAVSSGGVYTALQSAGGANIGWTEIPTAECPVGSTQDVDSIYNYRFWYCAALGLVRFMITARTDTPSEGTSIFSASIDFDNSKNYKPFAPLNYTGNYNVVATGVASAVSGSRAARAANVVHKYADGGEDLITVTFGELDSATDFSVSGFYYTEDIPAGGET